MRKKSLFPLVPYVCVLVAVFVALNPAWLQPFPSLKVYSSEPVFSGERALEKLTTLVTRFPSRVAGSEMGQASAAWMRDEFAALGLEAKLETFDTFVPESIWDAGFLFQPMMLTHKRIVGTNVVAYSPGKTGTVVLFVAHRDVVRGTVQGAGDNGSGCAALLELARVLTAEEHFYSYMFVATDAEESGKQGAHFFVQAHPDLSVRMAITLDDVGYKNAQTVGLYNVGNARQSTPLWTVALAHHVLRAQNLNSEYLNAYYYWTESAQQANPLLLLLSLLNQRGLGTRLATDSEVLLERGYPTLGIEAVDLQPGGLRLLPSFTGPGYQPIGPTHSPEDALEQISAKSLEMSGRFVERYARSLEFNDFEGPLSERLYVIWQGRYLAAGNLLAYGVLLLVAFTSCVVLAFANPATRSSAGPAAEWKSFRNDARRDLPWLAQIGLLAVAAGLIWQLPRLAFMRFMPPVAYLLLTALLVVVGGLAIVRRRQYALRLWHFAPTVVNQRRRLVILLLLFYLAYSLLFSPFTAAGMLLLPFLAWSMARFNTLRARNAWFAGFILWSMLHGLFSLLAMYTATNRVPPWELPGLATWVLNAALWLVVLVYVFSTPPLEVVERK